MHKMYAKVNCEYWLGKLRKNGLWRHPAQNGILDLLRIMIQLSGGSPMNPMIFYNSWIVKFLPLSLSFDPLSSEKCGSCCNLLYRFSFNIPVLELTVR
jgi:hypothetical protein